MLHMDEIKMDAHLFDVEFAMRILKEHRKDDDDEYTAALSIAYELARKWKEYYTHSPRIYRGKEKTLELVSDTLKGGDVGYFTNGRLFQSVGDKTMKQINEWIEDDSYIFIRFFDGRADFAFMYSPDGKKEVGND